MKKGICLILLALCLVALVSCPRGESETEAEPKAAAQSGERELTIGVIGMSNFENYAAKYKREGKGDFPIRLVDYTDGGGTREDAVARLNADLAAGKGPDIIDFDTVGSRDLYARQGLLRDMSDYFCSEFALEDFYILDKLNSTDALYFFPSHFSVITAYGHPEIFGEMQAWDFGDYERLSALPQFADCPADTQESFLVKMHTGMIPRWLDLEQGICRFDDGDFAETLCFAATLGAGELSLEAMPEELVAEGKLLYSECWIGSPYDMRALEQAMGGPPAYIGYPTADGSDGTYAYVYALAGVNAATENADLAWKFIRYLIAEDSLIYDKAWDGIPILKDAVQEKVGYLLDPLKEFEGMTITLNDDGTFAVDGVHQDMTYDPMPYISQKLAEEFYALIDRAGSIYETNAAVDRIMQNNARRYFDGRCTLEEAVAETQTRASIYVAEQYG